jgi:hypothetical protein
MTILRQRMTEKMQNLSSTQTSYLQQVTLFARYFKQSPELLGPEEIRSYQVYLTNKRKLAVSSPAGTLLKPLKIPREDLVELVGIEPTTSSLRTIQPQKSKIKPKKSK